MPSSSSGLGRQILILVTPVRLRLRAHMKNIKQKSWILLGVSFVVSIFLNWLVFRKAGTNFPVIFRSNDFGINFLGNRNLLFQIPILGMVFVGINYSLLQLFEKSNKNLSKLLFFANIGVAVLILLISAQIYFLNR